MRAVALAEEASAARHTAKRPAVGRDRPLVARSNAGGGSKRTSQVFFVTGWERPPACNVRIPRKDSEGTLEGGEGSAPAPRSHAARGATRLLCGRMSAHISLRALCCCGSDRCPTTLTCTLVASQVQTGALKQATHLQPSRVPRIGWEAPSRWTKVMLVQCSTTSNNAVQSRSARSPCCAGVR